MLKNNLRIIYAESNTNASSVSKKTGIAKSTLSKIINSKTDVKLSTLIKLCDYLGCTLSELIEYIPDKQTVGDK